MIFTSITDLGMDEDDDEPVPLPNVYAAILKKVMLTVQQSPGCLHTSNYLRLWSVLYAMDQVFQQIYGTGGP